MRWRATCSACRARAAAAAALVVAAAAGARSTPGTPPPPALPNGGRIGEEAWIARTGAAVELRVVVPVHPSAEWSLAGQTITAEVPLRATVGALKATLADQTRLPANKQKLLYEPAGFLKDAHTLAFYNVAPGASLTLEVKERGGRKK